MRGDDDSNIFHSGHQTKKWISTQSLNSLGTVQLTYILLSGSVAEETYHMWRESTQSISCIPHLCIVQWSNHGGSKFASLCTGFGGVRYGWNATVSVVMQWTGGAASSTSRDLTHCCTAHCYVLSVLGSSCYKAFWAWLMLKCDDQHYFFFANFEWYSQLSLSSCFY